MRSHPLLTRLRRSTLGLAGPVLVALLVRATLVQAYHIPSGSMEDTLLQGDFVLAEKVSFGPHVPGRLPGLSAKLPSIRLPGVRPPRRGEIVIFEHPDDPSVDLIKRCIAVAGQVVTIRDKVVHVDGIPIDEPAGMKHADAGGWVERRDSFGPYTVPPGHIFVLGDNRDNSFDSRFYGAVPLANLRARPLFIYFSWNTAAGLAEKIRWLHLGPVR